MKQHSHLKICMVGLIKYHQLIVDINIENNGDNNVIWWVEIVLLLVIQILNKDILYSAMVVVVKSIQI